MDILDGLNPEQRSAVEHVTGPLLVIAGAGTGKTQVITRRIARLLREGHAKPTQILALTFTEKAAQEMADRLNGLIGWDSFSVSVMTFNAFGSALLNEYAGHIGRSTRGGLINDTQKALLLQQRMGSLSLRYYGLQADMFEFAAKIIGYIGRLQNAGITPEDYRRYIDEISVDAGSLHQADVDEQHDLAVLYEAYELLKRETATFDYHDQLAIPLQILTAKPNIAGRLRERYPFVLVDEYQDTSPVQDGLLRCIVPKAGNLFAVGDDDQAIYGFRGADIANIMRFTEHFEVKAPLALIQNYRSGQPILDAAYRLIRHNDPERLESKLGINKQLVAQNGEASVSFRPYASPLEELEGVVTSITRDVAAGMAPGEIAILARSNAVLRTYARALRNREIPFAISTSVNIFEQRELKNLWYLLKWIGNKATEESISHLVMGPFFSWPAARWRRVVECASDNTVGNEAALHILAGDGDEEAAAVLRRLDIWRGWADEDTVSTLAYRLVFASPDDSHCLADILKASVSGGDIQVEMRVMRVFDDLARFYGQIEDYMTVQELAAGDQMLPGYLARFPQPPALEVSETVGDQDGIQLLTVHASKGLEFDNVYVVNTTARSWSEPGSMGGLEIPQALSRPLDLPAVHEQRRLMYVAVTRARKALVVSAPVANAGGQRQAVSPLVGELLGHAPDIALFLPEAGSKIDKMMQRLQRFYPLKSELPARLPFESADGWITLGVGALEQYDERPHDFYLEKVLKISRPFGPQLTFGAAIHGVIQLYYEGRLRGERVPDEELIARLGELWSDRGYENRELALQARERAEATIKRFSLREDRVMRAIRATEKSITLEIPEARLRLRGRMDATFDVEDGIEIRDFKTGTFKNQETLPAKAKSSFQLRTYAVALEQLYGSAPAAVTLDFVVTGVEGSARLTPLILKNHRDKLVTLAERLRARDFAASDATAFGEPAANRYYGDEDDGDAS